MTDPRLAALPVLRKLAEERACEFCAAIRVQHSMMPDRTEGALYEAQLAFLSDLSRPASRDAVARLVAERIGLECGATAPGMWLQFPGVWAFAPMTNCAADGSVSNGGAWFVDRPHIDGRRIRIVPGISAVTDPTEALTLIALHVLGAHNG